MDGLLRGAATSGIETRAERLHLAHLIVRQRIGRNETFDARIQYPYVFRIEFRSEFRSES